MLVGGSCLWSPTMMRFFGSIRISSATLDSVVHPHSSTMTWRI